MIEDVNLRYTAFQAALDKNLGNETAMADVARTMGLKQNEDNPNEQYLALPIWDTYTYYYLDDEQNVIASIMVTPPDAVDKFKGKRQAFSMSMALAPLSSIETEQGRLELIDNIDIATGAFELVGDYTGDSAAMVTGMNVEGYITYFVLRMGNTSEEQQQEAIDWSSSVIERKMAED